MSIPCSSAAAIMSKEYIPAVGEGIEEATKAGILGGFPVLGVHANVYDGSYHEVDSSEMAFHIAGSMAFKEAMKKGNPVLLEPIMKVEVTMPEEYMGDVIGDINSRRGRIEGMEDIGGGKMDKRDYRVYTVMGDGELAEGSVWEAAMAGANYGLDNLCATIDRNRLQISGGTEEVMRLDSLEERFRAFGWNVIPVDDGNDVDQLTKAYEEAKTVKGRPTMVIANTVKGCGSAVMENQAGWHHKVPTQEEYIRISQDLQERRKANGLHF